MDGQIWFRQAKGQGIVYDPEEQILNFLNLILASSQQQSQTQSQQTQQQQQQQQPQSQASLAVGQENIVRVFDELMKNMARMKTFIRPSMCKPYGKQSESLQKSKCQN